MTTFHHKLQAIKCEPYSRICTVNRPGCKPRHGPPIGLNQALEFVACPSYYSKVKAEAKMSTKEKPRQHYFKPVRKFCEETGEVIMSGVLK